jgi:N-acetylglucosaminyldiphosphoundecaprenol N-acetyl-beta-D-mannosaminyltransferase
VLTRESVLFKRIVETAQIKIIDGVGVRIIASLLAIPVGQRVTGVDLMDELAKWAVKRSLKVLLIGGKPNLAKFLADCYNRQYLSTNFRGIEGIKDIKNVKVTENKKVLSIVADWRPHIMFVSFGSPYQEEWIYRNRRSFTGMVCMGVGGGFDYLGGSVMRAPKFIRRIGLEWLFRLVIQPWRIKRMLRLPKFIWLILATKLGLIK